MHRTSEHIGSARRGAIAAILLALCCLSMAVSRAAAQPSLEVRAIRGLDFGAMYRSSFAAVAYYGAGAALFEVKGKKGSNVGLMIAATNLVQPGGPAGRGSMNVTISSARCAYSLDNGMSWTPFAAGIVCQYVRLPSRGTAAGRVMVRVGGDVTTRNDQHRGDYSGCVTLTAIYE